MCNFVAGDSYKSRRKLLTSVFHFNMIKRYVDTINTQSDRFIECLKSNGNDFTDDVLSMFADVALNIIIG